MDYEQKYKEALDLMKDWYKDDCTTKKEKIIIEAAFPELKESEDVRIKQELIEYHKAQAFLDGKPNNKHVKFVAWLEKQGVPTEDELEALRIAAYEPTKNWSEKLQSLYEKLIHYKQGEQKPILDVEIPFSAEDSELQEVFYYTPNGFHAEIKGNKVVIKRGEQKPAWSEEDEKNLRVVVDYLIADNGLTLKHINWLKSLKDRVQPKQEWSEKDIEILESCISLMSYNDAAKEETDWLKSLRPQSQWKPSESDIRILEQVIGGTVNPINYHATLYAILEQLKKL